MCVCGQVNIWVPQPEQQWDVIKVTGQDANVERARLGLLERVKELQAEQEDRVGTHTHTQSLTHTHAHSHSHTQSLTHTVTHTHTQISPLAYVHERTLPFASNSAANSL